MKRVEKITVQGGLAGHFATSFKNLELTFGPPSKSDGYKVSGEWRFRDEAGNEYWVYDYKQTNLYDKRLPSPEGFRAKRWHTWNIGSNTHGVTLLAFKDWLTAEIQRAQRAAWAAKPRLEVVK